MSAAGISNAIIGFALVALLHGLLLHQREERRRVDTFSAAPGPPDLFSAAPQPPPFAASFIKPDPMSEMLEFANNDESWTACDTRMKPPSPSGPAMPTMCQRAESKYTDRAVVNTYENELAANGGDLGDGLRGYENMSSMAPPW